MRDGVRQWWHDRTTASNGSAWRLRLEPAGVGDVTPAALCLASRCSAFRAFDANASLGIDRHRTKCWSPAGSA